MRTFEVKAHWDPEAKVWWVESNNVPGLVAEAATTEGILAELRQIVPELLAANNILGPGNIFQVRMVLDETEELCIA